MICAMVEGFFGGRHPPGRTGRDDEGGTGMGAWSSPSPRRGGTAGGGMSRFVSVGGVHRTGELVRTIGDPFSGSEPSISMASEC